MNDQLKPMGGFTAGRRKSHSPLLHLGLLWMLCGLLLFVSVRMVGSFADKFGYDLALAEMPVLRFTCVYVLLNALFLFCIPLLVRATPVNAARRLLVLVLLGGVFIRLSAFGAPAILEDDYNRYLWDGAVVAAGESPYRFSPDQVDQEIYGTQSLQPLVEASGDVFWRINYPEFSTVYPPVAQAFFAASNWIKPFSLDAWRFVLLLAELGCVAFIVLTLHALGRSPLWAALYWWNPLVIKEVANSAHMEPVLMLPVLAAVWLAAGKRNVTSSVLLALGAGVKVWPILLGSVFARRFLQSPKQLVLATGLVGLVLAAMILPVIMGGGLEEHSGFRAFASQWRASSAAYLVSLGVAYPLTVLLPFGMDAPVLARSLLTVLLIGFLGWIAFRVKIKGDSDEVDGNGRETVWYMFLAVAAIYLLSASHTPWYFLWILPFLCFFPVRGLLFAGALIPLHYSYFFFAGRDLEAFYQNGVVWLIWLPVWGLLAFDGFRKYYPMRAQAEEIVHAAE